MEDTLLAYPSKERLSSRSIKCRLKHLWGLGEDDHGRPFFLLGMELRALTGSIVLLRVPSQLYAISIKKSLDLFLRYVLVESLLIKCPFCKNKPIPFLGEIPTTCPYCNKKFVD